MKNFTRRLAISTVAAGTLFATAFTPGALADTTTATVTGGNLSVPVTNAADFLGTDITGVAQTTTAALAGFQVADLRGTGLGWKVTAQSSQFTGVNNPLRKLPLDALSMASTTVEAAAGTVSPAPTMTTGTAWAIDAAGVKIASAAVDQGMGTYDFVATQLTLSLPADVYADAYISTVTLSTTSAP